MSFSAEVKEELQKQVGKSRHCQIAELAAMIAFDGIGIENHLLNEKYQVLVGELFPGEKDVAEWRILELVKMWDEKQQKPEINSTVNGLLLQQVCCRRAFLRGAFLAGGSISDPNKSYHFEIVCSDAKRAEQLQTIIRSFSVDAKIVQRKKSHVVYVKEGAQIVDMLAVMEANVALMDLENIRILKEMRNSVNRKVNCETANINKTVNAAVKQMEDIKLVRQKIGFEQLNEGLAQVAELRMQYPEATLKELGMMLNPQVGKSGVNHRLRKLSQIADGLRVNEEELL